MQLYDYCKIMAEKTSEMTADEIQEKMDTIVRKYYIETRKTNKYLMLLNRENADYTLFHCKGQYAYPTMDKFLIELSECLINRGAIKSIDLTEDKDAIMIWINDKVYYLFGYDAGVIEI